MLLKLCIILKTYKDDQIMALTDSVCISFTDVKVKVEMLKVQLFVLSSLQFPVFSPNF